jgi:hypothetical protein
MKVYIGAHKHNRSVVFYFTEFLRLIRLPETLCDSIGNKLYKCKKLNAFLEFIRKINIFNRRINYVKIDRYDAWNADSTLAIIILPLLKEIAPTKYGSPFVEDEDVPDNLKSTNTLKSLDDNDELDANFHARWEWVLNEMIWAFEQIQPDNDWESKYWSVTPEIDFNSDTESKDGLSELKWKTEGVCDWDGIDAHSARIRNGLVLFGKYYQNLWT